MLRVQGRGVEPSGLDDEGEYETFKAIVRGVS